jgi:hypothetical protein
MVVVQKSILSPKKYKNKDPLGYNFVFVDVFITFRVYF